MNSPQPASDGWNVLAAASGPGAITRIWCQTSAGKIRIEFDGQAAIDAPLANLFDGQLAPFGEPLSYQTTPGGGFVCLFPMGFAKSCRVLGQGMDATFEVQFQAFDAGTTVEPFRSELDDDARKAVAAVAKALRHGLEEEQLGGARPLTSIAADGVLQPGSPLVQEVRGAGTVRALHVGFTEPAVPSDLYLLHRCVIRLYWDGAKQPQVEAPLSDFFGSGFDRDSASGIPAGTFRFLDLPVEKDDAAFFMYSLFPMPFTKGMRLEIESFAPTRGTKFGAMVMLKIDRAQPADDAPRFNACFAREAPCRGAEFPILDAPGRGRFVGCALSADCPREAWWGAGGVRFWIDGSAKPVIAGVSAASYLGDAPGLHVFARGTHGVTRTGPYGKAAGYRWHVADSIPFQNGLRVALANTQDGGAKDVSFSAVAFWYGAPRAGKVTKLTAGDITPGGLQIPGAIEIEGNIRSEKWGNEVKEDYSGGCEYSGGIAARISTDQPIAIRIVTESSRRASLLLRVQPGRPFDRIDITDSAGKALGSVQYRRDSDGIYPVGSIDLKAGENLLSVKCTKPATLDCWILRDASK
ncbi:MAG: glycoside hydrolase family 172 protein [Phycisphaerae bacterium]